MPVVVVVVVVVVEVDVDVRDVLLSSRDDPPMVCVCFRNQRGLLESIIV